MNDKIYDLTNDITFQRIFGKVGNEDITKGFLEKILGINIESLTLDTNKRLIGNMINDKIGRVDVKAKLNDGTKVIIEMQVARYKYMAERLLYYWSQTYVGDLKRGEDYEELNKTIAILISVEDLQETKGIEEYHTKWEIREEKYCNVKLTEDLEIHIIELSKFKEGKERRPEDNWIRFIKAKGADELKKLSEIEKEIEEAKEELDRLAEDPEMKELYEIKEYELREKASYVRAAKEEGIEEGIKQGLKHGVEQGKKEIVLNMYKEKVKIEDIAKYTGISKDEIEKIIENE